MSTHRVITVASKGVTAIKSFPVPVPDAGQVLVRVSPRPPLWVVEEGERPSNSSRGSWTAQTSTRTNGGEKKVPVGEGG